MATFYLTACVALAEDVPKNFSYREMIKQSGGNVAKITSGMTRGEVLKVMGDILSKVKNGPISNPWKVEFYEDRETPTTATPGTHRSCRS